MAVEQRVTFCRICEAHCGLIATVDDGVVEQLRPDKEHPLSLGEACPKGIAFTQVQNDPDRVLHPLRRRADGSGFERVSWETALSHGRSFSTPEALADRKTELTAALATELDRPSDRVAGAVRAEINDRLDGAVRIGIVTPATRALALECFDRPADCDLRALRWESGLGMFRHHRR